MSNINLLKSFGDLAIALPLDATNGLTDLSGNGRNGTAAGGLTAGGYSPGPLAVGDDGATDFDGTDDRITTTYGTRRNLSKRPVTQSGVPCATGTVSATISDLAGDGESGFVTRATLTANASGGAFQSATYAGEVVAGSSYTASAKIVSVPVGRSVQVSINWYTAANAFISGSAGAISNSLGRRYVTATAPPTAAKALVSVYIISGLTGEAVDFDGILIEAGSTQDVFFPTTAQLASGKAGWLGTAHASASDLGCFANGTVRSIGGWARQDTSPSGHQVLWGSTNEDRLQITPAGDIQLVVGASTLTWASALPGYDQWFFSEAVVDEPNNLAYLYVNGTLVSSQAMAGQWSTGGSLVLGRRSTGSYYWNGKQQGVAVFERALTAKEIAAAYAATPPGLICKVNGRDLSPYLRVAHEDGLDPSPAGAIEPQFSGSAAIGDGQSYVADAVSNPEMSFPLVLKADTTVELYQLIRDIRGDLSKGVEVEYRSNQAAYSTFFDLEYGKLDPDFEFWLDQAGRCRAQLTLYRRPHGHTGTTRLLASAVGTGAINLLASGVQGDVDAQAKLRFAMPSGAVQGHTLLYGVKKNAPSGWSPEYPAALFSQAPTQGLSLAASYTLTGASGRMASQSLNVLINGAGLAAGQTETILCRANPSPDKYPGRYRVFAGVFGAFTNSLDRPRLRAWFDPVGVLPTASGAYFASYSGLKPLGEGFPIAASGNNFLWRLADLGELNFPSGLAGASPMLALTFKNGGATNITSAGSIPVRIEGLYLLPIDESAGVVVTKDPIRVAGTSAYVLDGVRRQVDFAFAGSAMSDRSGDLRGNWPEIPAGATSRIIMLAGNSPITTKDWIPNVLVGVSVAIRERFSYLR